MNLEKYLAYLVTFLKKTVKDAHAKGVIVGISGGIDSAVVAYLAKKAFPKDHLVVWMPIGASEFDWSCVELLVNHGQLNSMTVDLKKTHHDMLKTLKKTKTPMNDFVSANLQARLRMSTIYALGQANQYLVLGTDNYDEWYTGYFTKFGDGGVDVAPLIHLLKKEVKQLAEILEVPRLIIDRQPTAGLWEGQTDEAELGYSYDLIDEYLLTKKSDNKDLVKRIEELHKQSEHKRNLAIQPNSFNR